MTRKLVLIAVLVVVIGAVYMLATLTADLITVWMNPRIRLDSDR